MRRQKRRQRRTQTPSRRRILRKSRRARSASRRVHAVLVDANQVLAARTHGRDGHVFCRVVGRVPVHQEPLVGGRYLERSVFTRAPLARFIGIGGVALYLVGVLYREATGLVVGGYDHERVGIVCREGFPNLDGLVELLPGLYHELRVAVEGHLVYAFLVDHKEEAVGVLREDLDGLLRHLGQGDGRVVDRALAFGRLLEYLLVGEEPEEPRPARNPEPGGVRHVLVAEVLCPSMLSE